jgi:hypothetical protein
MSISQTSSLITLYARYEPTNDYVVLSQGVKGKRDVCIYQDKECTLVKARIPWHQSGRPTKASKTTMLNCYRWALVWLDDLTL